MPNKLILFDMDGVLLESRGYHRSLRASVKRIGIALGAPNVEITQDQIARFEAASVTNEWDTVAICAALILVHVWQYEPSIRLNGVQPHHSEITPIAPDFDGFLKQLSDGGPLPGQTAFHIIYDQFAWLNSNQHIHLKTILDDCRDIYSSVTLPTHQELVLGSQLFQEIYGLTPQFSVESYLSSYDISLMTSNQRAAFFDWLNNPNHFAGILTNRQSSSPDGFISAPEAELGARMIGFEGLPYIGSGILTWFATQFVNLPAHTLLKPNPVHTLALLQLCLGRNTMEALQSAAELWQGKGDRADWQNLDGANIIIFEDSIKGFISGQKALHLLDQIGLHVELKLIGVSDNPIKLSVLDQLADYCIDNINQIQWQTLFKL
jgi:hypothetical protein